MNYLDARALIDEIRKLGFKGNTKEENFIRSVSKQATLSSGQAKWLQDIYQKAAGHGTYERRQVI